MLRALEKEPVRSMELLKSASTIVGRQLRQDANTAVHNAFDGISKKLLLSNELPLGVITCLLCDLGCPLNSATGPLYLLSRISTDAPQIVRHPETFLTNYRHLVSAISNKHLLDMLVASWWTVHEVLSEKMNEDDASSYDDLIVRLSLDLADVLVSMAHKYARKSTVVHTDLSWRNIKSTIFPAVEGWLKSLDRENRREQGLPVRTTRLRNIKRCAKNTILVHRNSEAGSRRILTNHTTEKEARTKCLEDPTTDNSIQSFCAPYLTFSDSSDRISDDRICYFLLGNLPRLINAVKEFDLDKEYKHGMDSRAPGSRSTVSVEASVRELRRMTANAYRSFDIATVLAKAALAMRSSDQIDDKIVWEVFIDLTKIEEQLGAYLLSI